MTDEPFDWKAQPRRPLSREDVWELLRNGCNTHEVATAAGVSEAIAREMVFDAMPRNWKRPRLTRYGRESRAA